MLGYAWEVRLLLITESLLSELVLVELDFWPPKAPIAPINPVPDLIEAPFEHDLPSFRYNTIQTSIFSAVYTESLESNYRINRIGNHTIYLLSLKDICHAKSSLL
jgi:hypothetical protein